MRVQPLLIVSAIYKRNIATISGVKWMVFLLICDSETVFICVERILVWISLHFTIHINIMIYLLAIRSKTVFAFTIIHRIKEFSIFSFSIFSSFWCRFWDRYNTTYSFGTISGIIKLRLLSGDGAVEEWVRLYQRRTGQGVVKKEEAARWKYQTVIGCDK